MQIWMRKHPIITIYLIWLPVVASPVVASPVVAYSIFPWFIQQCLN
jgi:hypothetical protein